MATSLRVVAVSVGKRSCESTPSPLSEAPKLIRIIGIEAPPRISSGAITGSGTCQPEAETAKPAKAASTTGAVRPAIKELPIERRPPPSALSPAMMMGESTAICRTSAGMT